MENSKKIISQSKKYPWNKYSNILREKREGRDFFIAKI